MEVHVSIGMPVYNGEPWIKETIRCFLEQTFENFELIIADNASTDKTQEICENYQGIDRRIKYYRNKSNIGIANNYNKVFELSKSEYFKWASVNDYCASTFIEKCVNILDKNNDVVLCCPRTLLVKDDGNTEQYDDNLNLQDPDPCVRFIKFLDRVKLNNAMNGLIRSESLKKTHLNKNHFSSDINFIAELTLYGKFYQIPEYLFHRSFTGNTITSLKKTKDILFDFDPERGSEILLQTWKYEYDFFSAVHRAPLTLYQKKKVFLVLLKRLRHVRVDLGQELIQYVSKFRVKPKVS